MSDQYSVLGSAPTREDLQKLSPDNVHVQIEGLTAGYGKMEILHDFDLMVSKAQSLCLIGPNGAGKSTFFILFTVLLIFFLAKLALMEKTLPI